MVVRQGVIGLEGEGLVVPCVLCTGNNALVRLTLPMKASEIRVIMGKHSAQIANGIGENLRPQ